MGPLHPGGGGVKAPHRIVPLSVGGMVSGADGTGSNVRAKKNIKNQIQQIFGRASVVER